jgi:hypothetical protein
MPPSRWVSTVFARAVNVPNEPYPIPHLDIQMIPSPSLPLVYSPTLPSKIAPAIENSEVLYYTILLLLLLLYYILCIFRSSDQYDRIVC